MSTRQQVIGLVVWLVLSFGAAWAGSRFGPSEWFTALRKPSWNPPNWVFGPVWTLLYALMAVAAWLVWKKAGWSAAPALGLFVFQLVINALWTWIFFGLQRPGWAVVDIVALWLAILGTAVAFWFKDRIAAALLLPYLAWVSFAAVLNWTLWRLNR